MKNIEVLIELGNICHETRDCKKCVLRFVNNGNLSRCAVDYLNDKMIAKKVLKIIKERLKG